MRFIELFLAKNNAKIIILKNKQKNIQTIYKHLINI